MAQTVQRGSTSGKRKAPPDSDPPTPVPKKAKTATARKSTGGHAPAPRRNSGRQSAGCQRISLLCYTTWLLTGIT